MAWWTPWGCFITVNKLVLLANAVCCWYYDACTKDIWHHSHLIILLTLQEKSNYGSDVLISCGYWVWLHWQIFIVINHYYRNAVFNLAFWLLHLSLLWLWQFCDHSRNFFFVFYIHKVISTLHNSEISFEEDVLNNRRFRNSPILAVHCTLVLLCPVDQFYNNAALKHC